MLAENQSKVYERIIINGIKLTARGGAEIEVAAAVGHPEADASEEDSGVEFEEVRVEYADSYRSVQIKVVLQ